MNNVILLDGAYGVGKTTVANYICEISKGEYVCIDPDEVFNNKPQYYLLHGWPIPNNKTILSDIRKEVVERINENNIVIPITLNSLKYKQKWIEAFKDVAKVFHVVLIAEKEQILSRIDADAHRDKKFAMESLDYNLRYYQEYLEGSITVDTSSILPQIVSNIILEVVC